MSVRGIGRCGGWWRTALLGAALAACGVRGEAAINVYRVDLDSPVPVEAADGQQWATAYPVLDAALAAAQPGDEVWVAEGSYCPSTAGVSSPRQASFMLKDAVAVYGGFAGTETAVEERDPAAYETILHGDLAGDDAGGGASARLNNCYHVLQLHGAATELTRLDGFTISNGYAVSPLWEAYVNGGGIYVASARVILARCRFSGNMAQNNGGGVYARDSVLTVLDCVFEKNESNGYGAGLAAYPVDLGTASALQLERCTFRDNLGTYALSACSPDALLRSSFFLDNEGGALYTSGQLVFEAANCVFMGNGALLTGAVYVGSRSAAMFTQCTFVDADAPEIAVSSGGFTESSLDIVNSILWNETYPVLEYDPDISAVSVTGSLVRGGFPGEGNLDAAPQFRLAVPPCQPNWNSPAIDLSPDAGEAQDILGEARPQNAAFDAGAYEFGQDSDGGGLPDAYETGHGLAPGVSTDDGEDSDQDGLDNREEFRRGTDPQDDADPPRIFYVAVTGSNETGDGSAVYPWQTIGHALAAVPEGAPTFPVTINVAAGIYEEPIGLRPYTRLSGAGAQATILRHFDPMEVEHVVVRGAPGAALEKCTVTFPATVTATAELLRIEDVDMEAAEVEFNALDSPHAIAVFITGPGSSASVIHHCALKRAEYGVFAVDSAVNITRNTFEDLFEAGIFIRPPEGKLDGDAATPMLGNTEEASETGFNRFRMSTGIFVKNMTADTARAEYNDWGVYTEAEIAARVANSPGIVDYAPFLGKAMIRGCIAVEVLAQDTGAPIPDARHPKVMLQSAAVNRDAASSLYLFSNLEPGNYTCSASADGYAPATQAAAVYEGDVAAVTLSLPPGGAEGEGEPEGEPEKENAVLWCHDEKPAGSAACGDLLALAAVSLFLLVLRPPHRPPDSSDAPPVP